MRRGNVSITTGENPSLSVEGIGDLQMELLRGPDGNPTTIKNAMFGFAPEFKVGKGSGSYTLFGESYEGGYGETTDFEFSSESTEEEHLRA